MTYAEALQTTLAGEHAAIYVYGALGAQTSQSGTPDLYAAITDAYEAHRARRDQLVATLTDLGEEPVAAEPVYELPKNLDSTDAVTARALEIERSCASTYAFLVASSPSRGAAARGEPADTDSGPRTRLPGNPRDVPRKRRVRGPLVAWDRGLREKRGWDPSASPR